MTTAQGQQLSSSAIGNNEPDAIVLAYTKIEILAHLGNRPKGYINHTYWIPQSTPLISLPRSQLDDHQLVARVQKSDNKGT